MKAKVGILYTSGVFVVRCLLALLFVSKKKVEGLVTRKKTWHQTF